MATNDNGLAEGLPAGAGIGFKPEHFDDLLGDTTGPDFVEVHAENYMGGGGAPHAMLSAISARMPLSLHGVGLSLGGSAPPDPHHLERLSRLVERYRPAAVSEHLAWSVHEGTFFGDLLPLPYAPASLERIAMHLDMVQQRLGRQLLLENPSAYLSCSASTLSEGEFLAALVQRTGCGLLLDLNNVVISCHNLGGQPLDYLKTLPLAATGEIHLAGHAVETLDDGSTLLIDDHGSAVDDGLWQLYRAVLASTGPLPTLIEWDTNVPDYAVLAREAARARGQLDAAAVRWRRMAA